MIKVLFLFSFIFLFGCSSIDEISGATKINMLTSSAPLDK